MLVGEVEGGSVDERESEDLRGGASVEVEVDVDGRGTDVRCVATAALDELCDGSELVLCGCRGDVAGVEEETEEGGLSGALASDHESVSPDVLGESLLIMGREARSGAQAVGGIVGGGGDSRDELAVVVGDDADDALVAAVDDVRHDWTGQPVRCCFRARVCPRGEASAGMINTEIPENRAGHGTERQKPSQSDVFIALYFTLPSIFIIFLIATLLVLYPRKQKASVA